MELSKEQLITALDCCANYAPLKCNECPFPELHGTFKGSLYCSDALMRVALATIQELLEENKNLKDASQVEFLQASSNMYEAKFNEAKAELELKNAEIETLKAAMEVEKMESVAKIFDEFEDIIDTYGDEYGTMLVLDEESFVNLKNKYFKSEDKI